MIIPTDPASTSDSASIFHDGKLKPGIYRIQNIVSQTYLDIRNDSKQLQALPGFAPAQSSLIGGPAHPASSESTRSAENNVAQLKSFRNGNCRVTNFQINNSLYVTFVVVEHSVGNRTIASERRLILDSAVYNWPCVKTFCVKSTPTRSKVRP